MQELNEGSFPPEDAEKRRRFITKLAILISGGMFIDGFILGGIGTVMPAITNDLQLSLSWQGLIGASALIGIFLGGPIGGFMADKIGRKPMFTIDLMIFLVGSVLQFFVAEAWQLFAVRLLMGMAIGADYAIGWPLLAEFAPARMRGKLLALQEVGWYAGYLIAYALGYMLALSDTVNWNLILGLSTIPTVIVLLMRLGTPESPRWLISRGRTEEAQAIAIEFMEEAEQRDLTAPQSGGPVGFGRLFSPQYAKATAFVSIYWACCVTPYFAIGTFAPVVLEHLGLEDGLAGGLALNFLALLGTVFTALVIERVGRRKLSIPPLFISGIALALLALLPSSMPSVIVLCVLVFGFVIAIANALTGVYPAEVFPTEIRGTGVGFATAVSRIGAAGGTFLLPAAIAGLGMPVTMLIMAGICIFGAIFSHFTAPETTGKLLSETAGPG